MEACSAPYKVLTFLSNRLLIACLPPYVTASAEQLHREVTPDLAAGAFTAAGLWTLWLPPQRTLLPISLEMMTTSRCVEPLLRTARALAQKHPSQLQAEPLLPHRTCSSRSQLSSPRLSSLQPRGHAWTPSTTLRRRRQRCACHCLHLKSLPVQSARPERSKSIKHLHRLCDKRTMQTCICPGAHGGGRPVHRR